MDYPQQQKAQRYLSLWLNSSPNFSTEAKFFFHQVIHIFIEFTVNEHRNNPAPELSGASTVLVPNLHRTDPADSLILNPDY